MNEKNDLYTLRWHINNWSSDSQAAALRILGRLIGGSQIVDRPATVASGAAAKTNTRQPWYPLASTDHPASRTRGSYPQGGPEGAIVHWTAGRPNQSLSDAMAFQAKQGYTYFCIDEEGNVGQNFPLTKWGYHAGKSYWPGFGNYVSNRVVGIEVLCPGMLNGSNAPWFDKSIHYPDDLVRTSDRNQNIAPGHYYRYTEKQERSLTNLLLWLNTNFNCFDLDSVLGHDEVSPGRKVDPGASLSMAMPEYRLHLKEQAFKP